MIRAAVPMKARKAVRRWFYLGNAKTPAGSALLIEQFRILTTQVPVLYGVLIINSMTISYVLPPSLPFWFRFGVTGLLLVSSASRIVYWVKLRGVTPPHRRAGARASLQDPHPGLRAQRGLLVLGAGAVRICRSGFAWPARAARLHGLGRQRLLPGQLSERRPAHAADLRASGFAAADVHR